MKVRFLARAGRQVRFLLILHLISFLFFSFLFFSEGFHYASIWPVGWLSANAN